MARSIEFDESQVLQKALNAFWQNGYSNSSTRDLAAATEISYSSLYNRFKDKQQLFIEVLDLYEKKYICPLYEILEKKKEVKPTLKKIFDLIIENATTDSKGCLMTNTILEAQNDELINQKISAMLSKIENAFYNYLKDEIQDENPKILAKYIVLQITGIRMLAKAGYTYNDLQRITKIALTSI